jgi:hypothetical protein
MQTSGDVEVADIFRQYGPDYRKTHPLPREHLRVMRAIEVCRTAALGGHVDECNTCGAIRVSYNSCRNRHCPKCQFLKKEQWLEARRKDLLPVPYFHVVFTIPAELNPLALRNRKTLYGILFRSVSETLMELARAPKHLGAQIGFIGILHTWGQNLMEHPHIHCIVSGGGLSNDTQRWIPSRSRFFLPVRVLSRLFRGKFLAYLQKGYDSEALTFPGTVAALKETDAFRAFMRRLYRKEWVVYCKPPFKDSEGVLQYLGRYTHRVAIANHRVVCMENGRVSFLWRDYADNKRTKIMTLDAGEFIRRFLLHVLPDRFVKIRYYGLLGSRKRKGNLVSCRTLLGVGETAHDEMASATHEDMPVWQELMLRVSGIDLSKCLVCGKGRMCSKELLRPLKNIRSP